MNPIFDPHSSEFTSVGASERIAALDSLRGLAVLGILLLNITGFGLASGSAEDPALLQNRGINFYCWYIFGHGVFEGSFRAIFSMLFGASTLILIAKLEERLSGQMPTEYFVRRLLWLLFFGLFNAFILLWPGDILFHYAVCGVVLLAFRSLSPKKLIFASVVCLLFLVARENKDFLAQKHYFQQIEKTAQIDPAKSESPEQKKAIDQLYTINEKYNPENKKKDIENEIRIFRSGYLNLYKFLSEKSIRAETTGLYYFHFFDVLIFMLLGMAFYKLGIIQGQVPIKFYGWMAVLGLIVGLALSYLHLRPVIQYNFNNYEVIHHKHFELYELQRSIRSVGIFGLIMLLYKLQWFKLFFAWMKPVGQMALSNYLSQSLICALIFYGLGLKMFGRFERYELYFIVAGIWILQTVWSYLWLRNFRHGPLEWLWRCLTFWSLIPIKKTKIQIKREIA